MGERINPVIRETQLLKTASEQLHLSSDYFCFGKDKHTLHFAKPTFRLPPFCLELPEHIKEKITSTQERIVYDCSLLTNPHTKWNSLETATQPAAVDLLVSGVELNQLVSGVEIFMPHGIDGINCEDRLGGRRLKLGNFYPYEIGFDFEEEEMAVKTFLWNPPSRLPMIVDAVDARTKQPIKTASYYLSLRHPNSPKSHTLEVVWSLV